MDGGHHHGQAQALGMLEGESFGIDGGHFELEDNVK
jgi:hypothetical protein